MAHYLRLIRLFLRTSLQWEVAFRANFAINLLNTVLTLVVGIGSVVVLFSQVQTIRGWTFAQTLTLLGVYLTVGALRDMCVGPSLETLGGLYGEILTGNFDFTLLKPAPAQFLVSFRSWRPWAFADLLFSLAILGVALMQLGTQFSLLGLATFLLALLVSVIIVYAILLFLASAAFWYQGVPLMWIFDSVIQMGRYPVGIYPGWLKLMLTWVIPIGFITTVPVEALIGQMPFAILLAGIAIAIILFAAASAFFRASLRRYVGASG